MRDHASNPVQDPTIWSSYRRAALRGTHALNGNSISNEAFSVAPLHQLDNEVNFVVSEMGNVKQMENDTGMDRLRMEIKRLKRVIRKKDLVIDLLMERIVKLQKSNVSAKDGAICNEHLDSIHYPSSSNAVSLDVLCDSSTAFQRKFSLSSVSSVTTEDNYILETIGTQSSNVFSNAAVKSESVIGKSSKRTNSRRHESHSRTVSQRLEVFNSGTRCSPCLNTTFTLHDSSGATEVNVPTKTKDHRNVVKYLTDEPNQDYCKNSSRHNRNVFVIEGFSSSSEGNDPDWKTPLPPSLCLRKNRPELIRRIEQRQAAIRVAAILRHRVTEEKMKAARDVIQGKCTVNNVRRSLMLDPTRITAFPKSEMINLTKRRLRASFAYKSEISGGKSRIDIAASKIIAHTFSEATRQAMLAGRSRGC